MKPLVFLPGWGTTAEVWRQVIAGLDRRCPRSFLSWRDTLSGGKAWARQLGEDSGPAVVVGWSLGGLLALRAAAAFPERTAGLVLVAATARMTAEGDYPGVSPKVLRGMILKLRRDREAVLREFAANALHPQRDSRWEGEFLAMAAAFETQDLLRGLEFLAAADLRDCLREIRLPVRILHGSGDRIIPPEQAVCLHQWLAGSTLMRIEGAGHHLLSTHPDQIVAAIEALADDRRAD